MSKINIDNELCNYIDANDGQVTLGGLAEHFAEYGYQYAVDKACEWLSNNLHLVRDWSGTPAQNYRELVIMFRKEMQ